MQFIDDAEFQVAIDLDGGGRITSLQWREMESVSYTHLTLPTIYSV